MNTDKYLFSKAPFSDLSLFVTHSFVFAYKFHALFVFICVSSVFICG